MIYKRFIECFVFVFKMINAVMQMTYGLWRISKLSKPIVSIFGSSRIKQNIKSAHQAHQIGRLLIDANISVLTGGGPGIMEAANCGAFPAGIHKEVKSIGIGVKGLAQRQNPCTEEYFEMPYFWARKWLLTNYADGFIVFPGGFGTLDELFEILTLIQTGRLKKVPIVLVDTLFWAPFMEWLKHEALGHGLVEAEHIALFRVTDDPYQAFCFVRDMCEINNQ